MGLRTRLASALELPSEVLGGMQTVVHGREEVTVDQCQKILGYTTSEILLRLRNEKLRIFGEKLTIMRYSNGNITVRGRIDQLVFSEKAEGGGAV